MWTFKKLQESNGQAEVVCNMLNTERNLLNDIKKRKLGYFENIKRQSSIKRKFQRAELRAKEAQDDAQDPGRTT